MKKFLLVALASGMVVAEQKEDAKKVVKVDQKDTLARSIIDATMFTDDFEKGMKASIEMLAKQLGLPEKKDAIYKDFMGSFKKAINDQLAAIYTKNFSVDELKEIEKWQKGKIAQKLTSLAPDISKVTMEASQKAMMEAIEKYQDEIAKKAKKAEKPAAKKVAADNDDNDEIIEEVIVEE